MDESDHKADAALQDVDELQEAGKKLIHVCIWKILNILVCFSFIQLYYLHTRSLHSSIYICIIIFSQT